MSDWAAWGDDELDWDRNDVNTYQAICDGCQKVSKRRLSYRDDLGERVMLCAVCVDAHDNHPQVVQEREHIEAMDASDRDDF